jgi:glyceraldehyde 3-phosphate dehydrogenase
MLFRYGFDKLDIVGVNDLTNGETLAHLLKYDSTHGIYPREVSATDGGLTVDGKKIRLSAVKDPTQIPWKDWGVDVVLECTGAFKGKDDFMKHLAGGAKRVMVSAPAKGVDQTIVYGINHKSYDPAKHHVISNASCTTNCLAPMAKVLNDSFGIEKGTMMTIHSFTNDQRVLDAPHSDLRRARTASLSMIPTTTGAAKAVSLVLPELEGKLDGLSVRVPTPNVSVVDLKFVAKRATSKEEINAAIKAAADSGPLKGILGYTERPNVSIDFNHDPRSSVFHMDQTKVIDGTFVRILSWYDNEWGFSNRMGDTAVALAKLI